VHLLDRDGRLVDLELAVNVTEQHFTRIQAASVPAYVSIRQHTSAYVSIPAYISIRQRTRILAASVPIVPIKHAIVGHLLL
jgi:hypothetical protein